MKRSLKTSKEDDFRQRVNKCGKEFIPCEDWSRKVDIYNKKKLMRRLIENHLKKYDLDIKGLREVDMPVAFLWSDRNKMDEDEGIWFLCRWMTPGYKYAKEGLGRYELRALRQIKYERLRKEREKYKEETEGNRIIVPIESIKPLTEEEKRVIDKLFKGEEDEETDAMIAKWKDEDEEEDDDDDDDGMNTEESSEDTIKEIKGNPEKMFQSRYDKGKNN